MTDSGLTTAVFDARVERRNERREFFKGFGTALALGGGMFLTGTQAAQAQATGNPAAPTEVDVLQFALNLEYLEAEFYLYAINGTGLTPADRAGSAAGGPQGAVNATGARAVTFTDPLIAQYAREIAIDEQAHVRFLRTAIGNTAVAEPAIDIGVGPNNAFTAVARAANMQGAGIALNAQNGTAFDPYASDDAFLLGAFIFEDVGVTAYKGGSPLINTPAFIEAAAGILAVEAYHAAIIRTTLYGRGYSAANPMPTLIQNVQGISDLRDALDSTATPAAAAGQAQGDDDQGIARTGTAPTSDTSNIAPLDANGLAYSRTAGDVLNIAYGTAGAAASGGFFPAGMNGNLKFSTAG